MNALVRGALAGALATVPMTAFMMGLQRALPRPQRYALPPRLITEEVTERAHLRDDVDEPGLDALTMLSHFGYGAGMGALYGVLAPRLGGPAALKGPAFGLVVWSGSYMGLIPALGLLPPASRQPPQRNGLMIAAHLVYGGTLGMLEARMGQATPGRRSISAVDSVEGDESAKLPALRRTGGSGRAQPRL